MRIRLPNLSRAEIERHTAWLCQWHRPCEVLNYYREVVDEVGDAALFNRGNLGFLRDAWAAGEFGRIRGAHRVRLVRPDPPDFELRFERGPAKPFEFKEAILPGRRRGDEYKKKEMLRAAGRSTLEHDPIEQWETRRQQIPTAIGNAIAATKLAQYAAGTGLLVYLNIGTFGLQRDKTEATFKASVQAAHGMFDSVWILWDASAYCVCPRWRKLTKAAPLDEI